MRSSVPWPTEGDRREAQEWCLTSVIGALPGDRETVRLDLLCGPWQPALFDNDDFNPFDFCPLDILFVLFPVFVTSLLNDSHLHLMFAFWAMVPERRRYLHVASAIITGYFHVAPPRSLSVELRLVD